MQQKRTLKLTMAVLRTLLYLVFATIVLQQGILITNCGDTAFCTHPVLFLVEYNYSTHICINGAVMEREPVTTESKANEPAKIPSKYRGPCASESDEFECGLQQTRRCGWDKGTRCCGQRTYNPDVQTCCAMTEYDFKIYNQPEKHHVCCGKILYPRLPEKIRCNHPAKNDPFWSATFLPAANNDYKLCRGYKYGYIIKFRYTDELKYITAIREFTFSSDYRRMYKASPVNKPMIVDHYSPKSRLSSRGRFIVLAETKMTDGLDFFLRSTDLVIRVKSRKSKMAKKRLRQAMKIMRRC